MFVDVEMTMPMALKLKLQLAPVLESAKKRVDLSAVREIDSAGLQLMMYLKHEISARNIRLNLIQRSKAVVEAIELLDLSKYFGDAVVISADRKAS